MTTGPSGPSVQGSAAAVTRSGSSPAASPTPLASGRPRLPSALATPSRVQVTGVAGQLGRRAIGTTRNAGVESVLHPVEFEAENPLARLALPDHPLKRLTATDGVLGRNGRGIVKEALTDHSSGRDPVQRRSVADPIGSRNPATDQTPFRPFPFPVLLRSTPSSEQSFPVFSSEQPSVPESSTTT